MSNLKIAKAIKLWHIRMTPEEKEKWKEKISKTQKALGENHWTKRLEVRKKISDSHMGKLHSGSFKKGHGKIRTNESYRNEETRKKISKSNKGKKRTNDIKEKLKIAKLNYYKNGGIHPLLGKHRSKETKQKIREKLLGEKSINWIDGRSKTKEGRNHYTKERQRRKKGAIGSHTLQEWQNLKAQYNWTCPCCKKSEPEIKLTEDHIIPLSKGGSNNIENIQPLCRSCNSRKYNKIIKYE